MFGKAGKRLLEPRLCRRTYAMSIRLRHPEDGRQYLYGPFLVRIRDELSRKERVFVLGLCRSSDELLRAWKP